MPRLPPHLCVSHVQCPDGTRIRYFDTESHLPTIVLANGLGGPISAWRPHVERLRHTHRIITWDYRGLYGSTLGSGAARLGVRAHVEDLKLVLDAAGIERAVVMGWSMGVQVALEFYRLYPGCVNQLVLMNGTFGQVLSSIPVPFSRFVLPPFVKALGRMHNLTGRGLKALGDHGWIPSVLQRLGVLSPAMDHEYFQRVVRDFKTLDFTFYMRALLELDRHDATAFLPLVHVPTLIVAGARDHLTPPHLASRMAAQMPNADVFVVPGATHYGPAEYPTLITERILRFIADSAACQAGRQTPTSALPEPSHRQRKS